jgi:hypothetical protein
MLSKIAVKRHESLKNLERNERARQNSFCAFCASLWQTAIQMP